MVYDGGRVNYQNIIRTHHLGYYLQFFDRIRILYWAKAEDGSEVFFENDDHFVFHPYCRPHDSGYITGIKFMYWIGRTLSGIFKNVPTDVQMVLMAVIPIWAGLPTLIVGKLNGKKVLLRLEAQKIDCLKIEEESWGIPKYITRIKVLILKVIYFLTIPFYDFVIGISKDLVKEAQSYRARYSILIYIPVDLERFKPHKIQSRKEILILSVGQIKKRKGFGEIIEALRLLKKEGNDVPKLLIVGEMSNPMDQGFFNEIRQRAEGLGVIFSGQISPEKMPEIYSLADILVHASYVESLGLTMMEAMASGLPIIATKTSGGKELIEDGRTGFLVSIKDPLGIKEKIQILMKHDDMRRSMGEQGREKIEIMMQETHRANKKLWEEILR